MGRMSQELSAELSPSNRLRRLPNVAGQTGEFGLTRGGSTAFERVRLEVGLVQKVEWILGNLGRLL